MGCGPWGGGGRFSMGFGSIGLFSMGFGSMRVFPMGFGSRGIFPMGFGPRGSFLSGFCVCGRFFFFFNGFWVHCSFLDGFWALREFSQWVFGSMRVFSMGLWALRGFLNGFRPAEAPVGGGSEHHPSSSAALSAGRTARRSGSVLPRGAVRPAGSRRRPSPRCLFARCPEPRPSAALRASAVSRPPKAVILGFEFLSLFFSCCYRGDPNLRSR